MARGGNNNVMMATNCQPDIVGTCSRTWTLLFLSPRLTVPPSVLASSSHYLHATILFPPPNAQRYLHVRRCCKVTALRHSVRYQFSTLFFCPPLFAVPLFARITQSPYRPCRVLTCTRFDLFRRENKRKQLSPVPLGRKVRQEGCMNSSV